MIKDRARRLRAFLNEPIYFERRWGFYLWFACVLMAIWFGAWLGRLLFG